jgi:hypothetical protein
MIKVKNKFLLKLTVILMFAAVIVGCATPTEEDRSKLAVKAAACIQNFARKLDDRISPADTIAVGVMSKCQAEINAFDEVRLPNIATAYGSGAWAGRNIGWMKQITSIVLEARAERR